jgi:hypothetical protein
MQSEFLCFAFVIVSNPLVRDNKTSFGPSGEINSMVHLLDQCLLGNSAAKL